MSDHVRDDTVVRAEGLATSLQDRSLMQRAVDSLVQALDG